MADEAIMELWRRVAELEGRMERVEALVGGTRRHSPPPATAPILREEIFSPESAEAPTAHFAPSPTVPAAPLAVAMPTLPHLEQPNAPRAANVVPTRATPTRSLESIIGENWAGWIGAIVFVLG